MPHVVLAMSSVSDECETELVEVQVAGVDDDVGRLELAQQSRSHTATCRTATRNDNLGTHATLCSVCLVCSRREKGSRYRHDLKKLRTQDYALALQGSISLSNFDSVDI